MVIVKAFDQAIWYLKIMLPEDTLFAEFTYATATLLQPLPFLKGHKCKPASKGLQKHIYSADGQIVIPPVSRPFKQSVSQAASWAMSTQRYVSITSSPTVMQTQSFTAVKFQGWNVQGATDWRYAPGNLEPFFFFYPFFTSVLHHCISYLLSGKKIKIQAFEKLQIIWNTFWTFILKWGAAAAASAASVRFGAKLIIPHKRALLSVLTQGWDAG